jgi:hypothetical protein
MGRAADLALYDTLELCGQRGSGDFQPKKLVLSKGVLLARPGGLHHLTLVEAAPGGPGQ